MHPDIQTSEESLSELLTEQTSEQATNAIDYRHDGLAITVTGPVHGGKTIMSELLRHWLSARMGGDVLVTYENTYGEHMPTAIQELDYGQLESVVTDTLSGSHIRIIDGPSTPGAVNAETQPITIARFTAQAAHRPANVMVEVVSCPDFFSEADARALAAMLVERVRSIDGLNIGLSPKGQYACKYEPVQISVSETENLAIYKLLSTMLVTHNAADPVGEPSIGPFELLFVEPNSTYTEANFVWGSESVYLDCNSLCDRSACRDVFTDRRRDPAVYTLTFKPDTPWMSTPELLERGTAFVRGEV